MKKTTVKIILKNVLLYIFIALLSISIVTVSVCSAAAALFLGIPALKYSKALEHMEAEEYAEAYVLFREIKGYKDSEEYLKYFKVTAEKESEYTHHSDGSKDTAVKIKRLPELYIDYYNDILYVASDCQSEYTYDRVGRVTSATHIFPDGKIYRHETVYNPEGRIIEAHFEAPDVYQTESYWDNGTVKKTTKTLPDSSGYEVEYDVHGRCIGVTTTDANGAVTAYKDATDENGNILMDVFWSSDGMYIREYAYGADGSKTYSKELDPDGRGFIEKVGYDDEGRYTVEKTNIYSDGGVKTSVKKYFDNGKYTVETVTETDGSVTEKTVIYDGYGKALEEKSVSESGSNYNASYSYYENGKLSEIKTIYESGKLSVNKYTYYENGQDKETVTTEDGEIVYLRSYNENGKWLKSIDTFSDGTQEIYEFIYNERDMLLKKTYWGSRYNRQSMCTEYTYDNEYRLIKETSTVQHKDEEIAHFTEYTYDYDDQGRKYKETITHSDSDGSYTSVTRYIYGKDDTVLAIIGTHNSEIRYFEVLGYTIADRNNQICGYDLYFSYDIWGNVRIGVNQNVMDTTVYIYNRSGDAIVQVKKSSNMSVSVALNEYNEYGQKEEQTVATFSLFNIRATRKSWEYDASSVKYYGTE